MFSSLLYYQKNYATQLAPSVGKKERIEPAELIGQTSLKMAEENAFVLADNPLPLPSYTRGIK